MKKLLQNIVTFLIIFLIVNLIVNFFFPQNNQQNQNTITLTPSKTSFEINNTVTADLQNNTQNQILLKNNCPNEPLNVLEEVNGQWTQKHKQAQISCVDMKDTVLNPGDKKTVTFNNWNHALFGETGNYKLQAIVWVGAANPNSPSPSASSQAADSQASASQQTAAAPVASVSQSNQANSSQNNLITQQQTQQISTTNQQTMKAADGTILVSRVVESNEFQITPQGWIGWIWMTLFYQPLYNVLIFILSVIPGHDLGLAIILLTLLIRTILLIPNQRALESQRRMQEVQPKLNHIKEKYKDNQEMIGKETLAVMQEHKVNPLGSCLPLLIQFPILIALYQVVQNGLNPDNAYLLYSGLQSFNYSSINVIFLGILDLTKINLFVLPVIVGALQFFQMKLAIVRLKKKNGEKEKTEMDTANNMMLYMMPAMIAIFTASVPSGVGIYWSTSTLYGIAQQLVVNKKSQKDNVKVKVIEKK